MYPSICAALMRVNTNRDMQACLLECTASTAAAVHNAADLIQSCLLSTRKTFCNWYHDELVV